MALRNRFRSLLGFNQNQKDSADGESAETLSEVVYKDDVREFQDDPMTNEEVIQGIKEVYFSDTNFDASDYELNQLPEELILDEVDAYRNDLRRQLQAISKKLYTKVLDNHSAYVQELQRVIDLQKSLQDTTAICDRGRRQLDRAKRGVSVGGLGILAKHRKKQHLLNLLESIRTIKTLQQTDVRLKEMLEEEDYPGAINLCLECEKAARAFKHYKCISELSSNLQETLMEIEKQLDFALSRTCDGFDAVHYEKLLSAYRYLGKTQAAMDQLHIHFMNSINQTSFAVLLDHVQGVPQEYVAGDGLQHVHYTELCKKVGMEYFTQGLTELCKSLWRLMFNYHRVVDWHEQFDPAMRVVEDDATEGDDDKTAEATYNRNYIRQKLDHGLMRIWKEVQERIKAYLLGTDLAYFKYDDFIYVLDLVNRLIAIGEEFCGSNSETLHDSIRTQTVNYFKNYHRSKMEELRMFLENEVWELCPVKSSFKIVDLLEFRFIKMQYSQTVVRTHTRTPSGNVNVQATQTDFFSRYSHDCTPFDDENVEDVAEDVLEENEVVDGDVNDNEKTRKSLNNDDDEDEEEDDDDIPEELKLDYVDEKTGETPMRTRNEGSAKSRKHQKFLSRVPCVTNTTLNVLRVFGKYMQMMNVLKPIAFDVVICMSQLFDYYLFSVASFFSPEVLLDGSIHGLSIKLRTTLKRISDNLIRKGDILNISANPSTDDMKVPHPYLSPLVDLSRENTMYGLSERIIATESLVFLAKQFEFLHSHLEVMIPSNKRAFLSQFYSQTVNTASELRKPIYRFVGSRVIDYEQTLQLMTGVRWDIKDIMSQHNAYVDILVREFQVFSMRLSQLGKQIPIPKEASSVLWEHCIRLSNRTFVEGFSSSKKCSNEGRALMQLDFQQYLMKLEKLTDIRPIPDREYVETYVKAFYLTENEMERWIREHKEYSTKQLTSLVTCGIGSHITKKGRQRLLAVIDETDKGKPR